MPSQLAFGLSNPRDFLEKARREVNRLGVTPWAVTVGHFSEEHDIPDTAINAAISLWHVTDWVARSADPRAVALVNHAKSAGGITQTVPYKALRDFVLRNPDIAICHDLANGSKHLVLDRPAVPTSVLHVHSTHAQDLEAVASCSPGYLGLKYVAKVVMPDGSRVHAIEIFQRALNFWDSLFNAHGL